VTFSAHFTAAAGHGKMPTPYDPGVTAEPGRWFTKTRKNAMSGIDSQASRQFLFRGEGNTVDKRMDEIDESAVRSKNGTAATLIVTTAGYQSTRLPRRHTLLALIARPVHRWPAKLFRGTRG
jgi:hypothetical protein